MRIDARIPDNTVLSELGQRIRAVRLERNVSQEQLAEEAGVGRVTLQRMESGSSGTSLRSLIRILRALDLSESLDGLVPEPRTSPIQQVDGAGKARRRAGARRSAPTEPGAGGWVWGDETDRSR